MTDQVIECMVCQELSASIKDDQLAHCQVCGSANPLEGHFCPTCSSLDSEYGVICQECGAALTLICPSCGESNWSGAEACRHCSANLEIFEILAAKSHYRTADRLDQQMREAKALKESEELASGARMALLMEIEEERQAIIRERLTKQKRQERQMLILVFMAVALFLLTLIVYALVNSLS